MVKPNLVLELNEVTTEIAPLLILKSISKFSFSSRSVSNRILVQLAYFKTTGKKVLLYEWSGDSRLVCVVTEYKSSGVETLDKYA